MLLAYERQPATRSDLSSVVPDVYVGFFCAQRLRSGLITATLNACAVA